MEEKEESRMSNFPPFWMGWLMTPPTKSVNADGRSGLKRKEKEWVLPQYAEFEVPTGRVYKK